MIRRVAEEDKNKLACLSQNIVVRAWVGKALDNEDRKTSQTVAKLQDKT